MAELDYDEADRLIRNCKTYNFGMWAADKLAHEVAPALLARVRELEAIHTASEQRSWASAIKANYALIDRLERAEAERDAALSTIAKVEALHVPHPQTGKCAECTYAPFSQQSVAWPCPTVRAIREEAEDE